MREGAFPQTWIAAAVLVGHIADHRSPVIHSSFHGFIQPTRSAHQQIVGGSPTRRLRVEEARRNEHSQGAEGGCWLCGATATRKFKDSNLPSAGISSADFKITDSNYGVTGLLLECESCGFIRTADVNSVLRYYEEMKDDGYEESRAERALQARKLLEHLGAVRGGARLLDVGAGSGILVEVAGALGYSAEGVEPSGWLWERARSRGLRVHHGTLPLGTLSGPFDVVCLVDVLEHVTDPLELLEEARRVLAPNGRMLVVTPDVKSVAARLFGMRWWHLRIAHVGYFSRGSLVTALERAGLRTERVYRPGWYFTIGYLMERAKRYLPFLRFNWPSALLSHTVPLNLRDSLAAIARVAP